ncbi:MAG: hypothetical protein WDN08_06780 [Rhizomicrobium sp.]
MFEEKAIPAEPRRDPGDNVRFIWHRGQIWIVEEEFHTIWVEGVAPAGTAVSLTVYKVSADGATASDVTPEPDVQLGSLCRLAGYFARTKFKPY